MGNKAFEEIILFAIRKEVEASTLYGIYSNLARNQNVKKMFRDLKNEELKHKKILEGLKKEDLSHYQLKKIPDLKISNYSLEKDYSPDMNYQEALLLAIKREEKSVKLYQDLSKGATEPELKKMFQVLAQEESKHKLKLETEYDQNILTED
ncbi:MAG: ferritin family protein [candidate division Zixibacteria bacterium]|nr:ferritin family protein [candidate division Zixibacteria bacterium]